VTLDHFLDRRYEFNKYNCGHFVVEVWKYLTGEDLAGACKDFLQTGFQKTRRDRIRIEQPESPCLVVLTSRRTVPHVGIYWEGRMIHLNALVGARWEHLDMLPSQYTQHYFK